MQSGAMRAEPGNTGGHEQVMERFDEIVDSLDLPGELAHMGISGKSVTKKANPVTEFKAVCAVLWKLALDSSYPQQAENVFMHYLLTSPRLGVTEERNMFIAKVMQYQALMAPQRTADFSPVAVFLTGALGVRLNDDDRKSFQLRLALTIRRFYQIIFDNLFV